MAENSSKPLPGISSRAWEHPADRGALVALRKVPGFDRLLQRLSGFISERSVRMLLLGSAVRASERNFPRVRRLLREAGEVLDVSALPEVYVVADPTLNAMTIGLERPVIVLNSALVDLTDDDELRFVLGHELGHVQSGHALYRTLLSVLLALSGTLFAIPLGALGARGLMAALLEWSRKAELSADRAGLLVAQDPGVALRVHMKLASGGQAAELDADEFLAQAAEYRATDDVRDLLIRLLLVETLTHPFAVVRAGELRRWVDGGDYARILAGDYPLRADDADASPTAEARAAADSYAEQFADVGDTLGRLASEAAEGVGQARDWLLGRFRDLREQRDPGDPGRRPPAGW